MYNKKTILAIIPARGGSKGLPGKNIKLFLGKPLLAWSIEQAKKSRYIDKVIVSSESKEVLGIAKKFGAETPFARPKALALDKSKIIDTIKDVMARVVSHRGKCYDIFILLQPTSPLRTSGDIDEAVRLFFSRKARAIISVCEADHHPYLANRLHKNGCMKDFIRPEHKNKNRQDFPKFYRLNGAIFMAYADYLANQNGFYGGKTFAYIMPKGRSADIDDIAGFKCAEFLAMNMPLRETS